MLQEENENILDKVYSLSHPTTTLSPLLPEKYFCHQYTSFLLFIAYNMCWILLYSSDSRKRDARMQRPELESLRNRLLLCFPYCVAKS